MRKLVVVLFALSLAASAYAGTAFFRYETTSGFTKVCHYDYLGDTYTKNVSSTALCPLSIQVQSPGTRAPRYDPNPIVPVPPPGPSYVTGFYVREETGAFNKTCYYNALGDEIAKDVSSVSICPLTIRVRR